MTKLKKALDVRGIKIADVAKEGIPYETVWQQCRGLRTVSAQSAIRYEKILGIPRWELRPDLWDKPEE